MELIYKIKDETRYIGRDIKNKIIKCLIKPTTKKNLYMEKLGLKRHQYGLIFVMGLIKEAKNGVKNVNYLDSIIEKHGI